MSINLPQSTAEEFGRFTRLTGRNKSGIIKETTGLFCWDARFNQIKSGIFRRRKSRNCGP